MEDAEPYSKFLTDENFNSEKIILSLSLPPSPPLSLSPSKNKYLTRTQFLLLKYWDFKYKKSNNWHQYIKEQYNTIAPHPGSSGSQISWQWHRMVVRLSALHTGRLYPRKCSWYSFLLEAESTPGPQCDPKDFMSMKNSNDTNWDRTSDLPICSTVP